MPGVALYSGNQLQNKEGLPCSVLRHEQLKLKLSVGFSKQYCCHNNNNNDDDYDDDNDDDDDDDDNDDNYNCVIVPKK